MIKKKWFLLVLQSRSWLLHCSSDGRGRVRLHGCLKTHICTANKRELAREWWCRLQGERIYRFNFPRYWEEDGSGSLPARPMVLPAMCFTELLSVLWQDGARITDGDGDKARVGSSQQKGGNEVREQVNDETQVPDLMLRTASRSKHRSKTKWAMKCYDLTFFFFFSPRL